MKDQLVFDTSDAVSIADSDSVGAYVRSDDGTLITHHTVGSDEGLDVYILNPSIEVTATDLDIRDLDSATDSVSAVQSGVWNVGINGDVNVTQGTSPWIIGDGGNSITVDAVDLDIRDLTAVSDSVAAWLSDGSGNAITSTAGALDVNLKSPVTVDVDLDGIYNVTTNPAPDSAGAIYHTRAATLDETVQVERTTAGAVASILAADLSDINALDVNAFIYALNDNGDMVNFNIDSTSGGLDVNIVGFEAPVEVNDAALANTAILTGANTLGVADTAELTVASNLADRKYLYKSHFISLRVGSCWAI